MNEETGAVAPRQVTDLIRPGPKPLYALSLRNTRGETDVFHATDDHPWRVHGRGWVKTADLRSGDRIDTAGEHDLVVTSLQRTARVERTYNLTVADWHTFLIGEDRAVVHNVDCNSIRRGFERQLARDGRRSLERSLANTERRLAEHRADLVRYRARGGYTSSMEREIRTFEAQVSVLRNMLGR